MILFAILIILITNAVAANTKKNTWYGFGKRLSAPIQTEKLIRRTKPEESLNHVADDSKQGFSDEYLILVKMIGNLSSNLILLYLLSNFAYLLRNSLF